MAKSYIVLDTETTGLKIPQKPDGQISGNRKYLQSGKGFDEILQLAIVNQEGEILFNDSFLPANRKTWKTAQAIHNISPQDVASKQTFSSRLEEIQSIIQEAPLIIAYNASFDLAFLQGQGVDLQNKPYICAMDAFAKVYGKRRRYGHGWEWQSLEKCAAFFGLVNEHAHDALADAELTLACYKAMVRDGNLILNWESWR